MRRTAPILLAAALVAMVFALHTRSAVGQTVSDEERKALEQQLANYEQQIDQYEVTISEYQKQGKSLKSTIDKLETEKKKIELQIKAVNLRLTELDRDIKIKTTEIKTSESKLDMNRNALGDSLQSLYENGRAGYAHILLSNATLSDIVGGVNDLLEVQDSLVVTIDRIDNLKRDLEQQREVLSLKRTDAAGLKAYHDAKRTDLQRTQAEKAELLKVTKGQESNYQKLLVETKKTAAQIRSQIFKLLGGGELTFEAAYQFAKIAGNATGVRPAFILAILNRESALGQNVGKCGYKTAMNPKSIPTFLEITKELNLNPDTMLVSCPNADGAYGGAMGPAQFIPSTWSLYKTKISAVTGNTPPSPWRNEDAFMAAALYLADAGAATNEKAAAAKYYCGGNWNKLYVCLNVYGKKVVQQATAFEEDIKVITS